MGEQILQVREQTILPARQNKTEQNWKLTHYRLAGLVGFAQVFSERDAHRRA
jgi:hypothetical protein